MYNKLKKIFKLSIVTVLISCLSLGQGAYAWSFLGFGSSKVSSTASSTESAKFDAPPFYPYLDITQVAVTSNFGASTPSVKTELLEQGDGVIIAFILGVLSESGSGDTLKQTLTPKLGDYDLTLDPEHKGIKYVQAWKTYVQQMHAHKKKVIISFGGALNSSDLAYLAQTHIKKGKTVQKVKSGMQQVLDLLDTKIVAFDFDIEGSEMEGNKEAYCLYAQAVSELIHEKKLLGFTTKNNKLIQYGITIPTGIDGPSDNGKTIIDYFNGNQNCSSITGYSPLQAQVKPSYINLMAFDMGGNPTPAVNRSIDYYKLIKPLVKDNYALTFMPGDEDGAGGKLFLSPAGAANIAQQIGESKVKVPFLSMWQLGRDMQDTTDTTDTGSSCSVDNQSVDSVAGSDVTCTGQLQTAFAYTQAFMGKGVTSAAQPTKAFTVPSQITLQQVQDKDSGKWLEGYSGTAKATLNLGEKVQIRMFMDLRTPEQKKAAKDASFKGGFSWATTAKKSSSMKVALPALFDICDQSDFKAPCLARNAGSIDGDGDKNADKVVDMVAVAQKVNEGFAIVTGSATGSSLDKATAKVTLPILKNRVKQTGDQAPTVKSILPNLYSGHDLWITKQGLAEADWGPIVYKANIQMGDVNLSSSQSSGSEYIHLIFPNDIRATDPTYIPDEHDILVNGGGAGGTIGGTISELSISFLSKHGICEDPKSNGCINNQPGLKAISTVSLQQNNKKDYASDSNQYKYVSQQPKINVLYTTNDEAMLSWTPVATDSSGYIQYKVELTPRVFSGLTANTSIDITGLASETLYKVTITPQICKDISTSNTCAATSLPAIRGNFTTKTLSTAGGVPVEVKVSQDSSTKEGEIYYALFDIDLKPQSSSFTPDGNWPRLFDFSSGNLDEVLFQMRVQNENYLKPPTCRIINTKPQIVQDNTRAHSDGLNMIFDQSWFVTSSWQSKVWSCDLIRTSIIPDSGGSVPLKSVTVNKENEHVGYPGSVAQAQWQANVYTLVLNDLPGLFSSPETTVNLQGFMLDFTSTKDFKLYGTGAVQLSDLHIQTKAGDGTPVSVEGARTYTMTQTPTNGKYNYKVEIDFKTAIAFNKNPNSSASTQCDGDGKAPCISFTMPFNPDSDKLAAMNEALKNATITFVPGRKPGVKEYTYLLKRNDIVYPSAAGAPHPFSRWINYPLWLDNIFRVEFYNYPYLKQQGGLVRLKLGFGFPVSKDPSKAGSKDDIVDQYGTYYSSSPTTTWDTATMPKAKAFADTSFNPLSLLPVDKLNTLKTVKKTPPAIDMQIEYCKDSGNGATHFDLSIGNKYKASDDASAKPLQLWLPDQYNFANTTCDTPTYGWSIKVPLSGLDGTKFDPSAIGGIYTKYDGDYITFTSGGTCQGLRPDRLPITGAEAIYNGPLEVSEIPATAPITWTQQPLPIAHTGPQHHPIPTQTMSGTATFTNAGACSKPAPGPAQKPAEVYFVVDGVSNKGDRDKTLSVQDGNTFAVHVVPGSNFSAKDLQAVCGDEDNYKSLTMTSQVLNKKFSGKFLLGAKDQDNFGFDNFYTSSILNSSISMSFDKGECVISGTFNYDSPSPDMLELHYKDGDVTIFGSVGLDGASPPPATKSITVSPASVTVAKGADKSQLITITESGYKESDTCGGVTSSVTSLVEVTLPGTLVNGKCTYSASVTASSDAVIGANTVTISDKGDSSVKATLIVTVTAAPSGKGQCEPAIVWGQCPKEGYTFYHCTYFDPTSLTQACKNFQKKCAGMDGESIKNLVNTSTYNGVCAPD